MPETITTFDLSESFLNLQHLVAQEEIEENEYEDILQNLEGSAQDKLDNLSYVYKEFRAKEKTLMHHINDMRTRKKRFQKSQVRIKELMKLLLNSMQKRKVETAENTFSLVEGREKLQVVNENEVDPQFTETIVKVRKRKALDYYKDKQEVPAGFIVAKGAEFVVIRSK